MKCLRSLLLASVLLAPAARAQAPAPASESTATTPAPTPSSVEAPAQEPVPEVLTVAVLPFEASEAAKDLAPGITALLTSRLAESPRLKVLTEQDIEALRAERPTPSPEMGGCAEEPCLKDITRLIGGGHVVTGRVDRFGDTYLVTASLVEAEHGQSVERGSAEGPAERLPAGVRALADRFLGTLTPSATVGTPLVASPAAPEGSGGVVVGLRLNNSFISRLASLNPGADIELGYAFEPDWVVFGQVGLSFVRSNSEGREGGLNVLPGVVGLRHYHRVEHALRPYWGFGVGLQLSFGDFGILQSTGPLPTITGFGGVEYLIGRRVGLQLEAGTNVAQAVLGLAGDGLGKGINLDLNAGLSFHF